MRLFDYTSDPELNRSLSAIAWAAAIGTVFFSIIGGTAYTTFFRALNNRDSTWGLLTAIPMFAFVFRLVSSYLIERYHARRLLFLAGLYTQRAIFIPFALIPWLIPGTSPDLRVATALMCVAISGITGCMGDVAFMSWVTDLVPGEIRGNYFGQRQRLITLSGLIAPILVGLYLDSHPGLPGLTHVLLFGVFFGVMDVAMWHRVRHPVMQANSRNLDFLEILRQPLRLPAYRRLLIFWTFTLFAFGFVGPFTFIYNLEVLHLGNFMTSLQLQVIPGVVAFFLGGIWGRWIDRCGSKSLLQLCMICSAIIPLFWFFSTPATPWVQVIPNIIGGAIWIGLDLGQMNLMMKILPKENRSVYIAGYGLIAWLTGNAVGAMLSGFCSQILKPIMAHSAFTLFGTPLVAYQLLFLFSAMLRFLSLFVFLPRIEEPGAMNLRSSISTIWKNIRGE